MTKFEIIREQIINILESAGVKEIYTTKAKIPGELPSGIVSVRDSYGGVKVTIGFAVQHFVFDVYIVVEDSDQADAQMIDILEKIDNELKDKLFLSIEKTTYYDSMLSATGVRIAKFEVDLCV